VNVDTPINDSDTDILSVDTIYYPGVLDFIKKALMTDPRRTAHVIFNAYTDKPGTYQLAHNEGSFTIYEKNRKMHVIMRPEDNAEPYNHELF
jgi:hypothetical protein